MQSINQKKQAMREETAKLLVEFNIPEDGRSNEVVMPKGAMGVDSRGMFQCRLSRRGK